MGIWPNGIFTVQVYTFMQDFSSSFRFHNTHITLLAVEL